MFHCSLVALVMLLLTGCHWHALRQGGGGRREWHRGRWLRLCRRGGSGSPQGPLVAPHLLLLPGTATDQAEVLMWGPVN